MVHRLRFFASFLRPVFPASRVRHISDLHSKIALRPHHAENRRGKEEKKQERRKKKPVTTWQKYNGLALFHRAAIVKQHYNSNTKWAAMTVKSPPLSTSNTTSRYIVGLCWWWRRWNVEDVSTARLAAWTSQLSLDRRQSSDTLRHTVDLTALGECEWTDGHTALSQRHHRHHDNHHHQQQQHCSCSWTERQWDTSNTVALEQQLRQTHRQLTHIHLHSYHLSSPELATNSKQTLKTNLKASPKVFFFEKRATEKSE